MRRIKNKNLEELLNKPINNNLVFDIGYEHATANAIDWVASVVRCRVKIQEGKPFWSIRNYSNCK